MPRKSANTSIVFSIFSHTLLLCSSIFCVHFHCFGRPRIPDFRALESSGERKSSGELWRERKKERKKERALESSGELWQSKSDVFQHCIRTFLRCLSTFCVSCNTCCAHSYCIPALCAYIPTTLEHFLHAFLCVTFNACIPFIIFKRNGELESWRVELFKFQHF